LNISFRKERSLLFSSHAIDAAGTILQALGVSFLKTVAMKTTPYDQAIFLMILEMISPITPITKCA
jgi:hypothetical protein